MPKYAIASLCAVLGYLAASGSAAQSLVQQMVVKHRQSVVYLRVQKTTSTGEVVENVGTGFLVSARGHVLTNCHVVDKSIRDQTGKVLGRGVDSISIAGAVGSKEGVLEPMSFLACEEPGIDLALLKFKNTAVPRSPVKVNPEQPGIGDELGLMGFPLQTEFFARPGSVSSEDEQDRLLVSMVMNAGDSGGPVFDRKLTVVAIGEAGYGVGTGVGVVRPIRHGARLLLLAGINLYAVDAPLTAVAAPDKPPNSNIFYGASISLPKVFGKAASTTPPASSPTTLSVTYPMFQILGDASPGAASIDLKAIEAQPGYKVVGARMVITDKAGADVLHVGPSPDGSSVRAAFEKSSTASLLNEGSPYVRGFIETKQIRIK